jgi:hypothetical protein
MKYINLCPYAITIVGDTGGIVRTIEPSGRVARCAEQTKYIPMLNGSADIPLILRTYGQVEGLPEEDDEYETMYIVSNMVRLALPERADIASPGDTVRDSEGHIIGCKNLVVNPL